MTQEKARGKVITYLRGRNKSPLHFMNSYLGEKIDIKNAERRSLIGLIIEILSYNEDYYSSGKGTKRKEYYDYRTSLDIWRHVIYYRPEVTIFEVMKCIANNKEKFVGHICHEIDCRVFSNSIGESEPDDQDDFDEYGLMFKEWKLL